MNKLLKYITIINLSFFVLCLLLLVYNFIFGNSPQEDYVEIISTIILIAISIGIPILTIFLSVKYAWVNNGLRGYFKSLLISLSYLAFSVVMGFFLLILVFGVVGEDGLVVFMLWLEAVIIFLSLIIINGIVSFISLNKAKVNASS